MIYKKYPRLKNKEIEVLLKEIDKQNIDWSYIAGWIDGDGSVCHNVESPIIQLEITDLEPVMMLSDIFKTTINYRNRTGEHNAIKKLKDIYSVNIRGLKLEYLCKKIAPFIIQKTEQVYKCLEKRNFYFRWPTLQHTNKEALSYIIGFSEAEGCFSITKLNSIRKERLFNQFKLTNTNLDLLKYIQKRLMIMGYDKINLTKDREGGYQKFSPTVSDRMCYRQTKYALNISGYALLNFYKDIYDKMMIKRKKEKVKQTIEFLTNDKGYAKDRWLQQQLNK